MQTTQEARTSTSSQSGTQSGTTNPGGSSLGLSGTFTANNSASLNLECSQSAALTFHLEGSYVSGTWNLSCYAVDAASTLAATSSQSESSNGSHSGASYSASSSVSVECATSQSSAGTVHYAGTYAGGSLSLSSFSFALTGASSFSYARSQQLTSTGTQVVASNFSVAGGGNGSYSAAGIGSISSGGSMALACFSLTGGSAGTASSYESGTLGTRTYSRSDGYEGSVAYDAAGSLSSASVWNFSSYERTLENLETMSGQVGANTDSLSAWLSTTLTGTGSTGTLTSDGVGAYTWNTREYGYGIEGDETAQGLVGPRVATLRAGEGTLPPDLRTQGLGVVAVGGADVAGVWQQAVAGQQQALQGLGAGTAGLGTALDAPLTQVAALPQAAVSQPPRWTGLGALGPNGTTWVGVQGAASQAGAWAWLTAQGANVWTLVGTAYQQGWQRSVVAQPLANPLALQGQGVWDSRVAQLPEGALWWQNQAATAGEDLDYGGGDPTAWTNVFLENSGEAALPSLVNRTTAEYAQGVADRQALLRVLNLVVTVGLLVVPGGSVLGQVLRGTQLVLGLVNGTEAVVRGDWLGSVEALSGAALGGLGLARVNSPCQLLNKGTKLGTIGGRAMQGLLAVNGAAQVALGVRSLVEGDILGGAMSLLGAKASLTGMMQACFEGETPLETLAGWKTVETVVAQVDEVSTRDENDPDGPVVFKRVEQVFVRPGFVYNLHLEGGRVLGTTLEHPFYKREAGWVPCGELQPGDEIWTKERRWVKVEAVVATGEVKRLYNFRVADYHTYFVGGPEWGFAVWAHNLYKSYRKILRKEAKFEDRKAINDGYKLLQQGKRAEARKRLKGVPQKYITKAFKAAFALERPEWRGPTKAAIYAASTKKGKLYIHDVNAKGKVFTRLAKAGEEIHIGHIPGREHRKLLKEAKAKQMTQAAFNDWVNKHPEWFRLESRALSISHIGERP